MDINEALAALADKTKSHVVELRGEKGEKGDRGEKGDPGRDGKNVVLVIGKVIGGDEAAARIRQDGNVFVLDLCLPRGEQGLRGQQGLPGKDGERGLPGLKGERGERGPAGQDGETGVPGKDGERGERGSEGQKGEQGPQGVRGERGERGERGLEGKKGERGDAGERGSAGPMGERGHTGPQGVPGENAVLDVEELKALLISVLTSAGVMTEQVSKLIAVKAELKRCLHQATSRHQAELAEVYRRVDNIIG